MSSSSGKASFAKSIRTTDTFFFSPATFEIGFKTERVRPSGTTTSITSPASERKTALRRLPDVSRVNVSIPHSAKTALAPSSSKPSSKVTATRESDRLTRRRCMCCVLLIPSPSFRTILKAVWLAGTPVKVKNFGSTIFVRLTALAVTLHPFLLSS
jgi:hypothetical protein